MTDTPVVKAFTIRIVSGPYAGRYVGMKFGGGLVTNPEVLKNPPLNLLIWLTVHGCRSVPRPDFLKDMLNPY